MFVPPPLLVATSREVRVLWLYADVGGLESRSAQDDIQQGGVVSLDEEEEDLLEGDLEQLGPNNDMVRVAPYTRAD